MKKNWPLYLAAAVLLAYHYQHAMTIMLSPKGDLIFNDFAVLSYQCDAARNFFAESGRLWGYDPHYMAGFPLTFIWNSNVAMQAAAAALRGVETGVVIRLFLFASIMLFPLFFYWAMRNFGFSRNRALACTVAAALYFRIGVPMLFHLTGMVTAGMITYFAIFAVSAIYRYAEKPGAGEALLVACACAVAFFIHKTFIVIAAAPAAIIVFGLLKKKRFGSVGILACAGVFTVAANWFWVAPALKYMKYKTFLWDAPFWTNRDPLLPLKDYFTLGAKLNSVDYGALGVAHTAALWVLLIGGVAGMAGWRKSRDPRFPLFAGSVAFLFVFCYYGTFVPKLADLNPTRYLPVMNLLLAAPAADALLGLKRRAGGGFAVPGLFLAAALAGCLVTAEFLKKFDPMINLRLGTKMTADVDSLIAKIKSLPPEGRILLEDSGVMDAEGEGQVYLYSQLPAMFSHLTGRQFIGGPYPYVFEKYHVVDFHDGKLFGREIEDVPFDRFREIAETYDVTSVVAWSKRARFYFDSYPGYFKPVWGGGPFRMYALPRVADPFLAGSGTLRATFSRIELMNLAPEGGKVVLKYHWADTLRTEPPVKLKRHPVPDDPLGFIELERPPRTLRIVNP